MPRPPKMSKKQVARWLIDCSVAVKSPPYVKGKCWETHMAKDSCGYGWVGHKGKMHRTHRLVYSALMGRIDEDMNVMHRCDNPSCIRPKHLKAGTQQDNVRDMADKGRHVGYRKLTEEEVQWIRDVYADGEYTQPELEAMFNLSEGHVSRIVNRKTWRQIS